MLTHAELIQTHKIIDREAPESLIEACNYVLRCSDSTERVKDVLGAFEGLYALFQTFLDSDQYTEAALLIWGSAQDGGIFDPRPRSVRRIWDALMRYPKVLIPGGGSQGKSYTPAAWAVLNWVRDPQYTSGKVISVTESHAASNIFATIKYLHEQSRLDLPGRRMERIIDLGDGNKRASISQVSIRPGDDAKGVLRGFHPIIRPSRHPKFGLKSRLFVLMDEGEDVPHGAWEGIENMLSTEGGGGINIVSGANPKKRESPYAQRAEYPQGWEAFDMDSSEEWDGPENLGKWHVVRIDPSKSENVVERREVFPGMMTYEGYMNYVKKGKSHPDYYTFARGAWPVASAEFKVTPQDYFHGVNGEWIFLGDVFNITSLDAAFAEGGDQAIMTTGRYGTAIGFNPVHGQYIDMAASPKKVIQVEQQFIIEKDPNIQVMANSVMNYLRNLHVRPEWFIMDMTGNAFGLHSLLKFQFGGDIIGVHWAEAATEMKIMDEDTKPASERFKGIVSEMPFAASDWLHYGYIKFSPMMDASKIIAQASARTYTYAGNGLVKVETKGEFKARTGGISPDEYDSFIMLTHLCRVRKYGSAHILQDRANEIAKRSPRDDWKNIPSGVIDRVEFINVTE